MDGEPLPPAVPDPLPPPAPEVVPSTAPLEAEPGSPVRRGPFSVLWAKWRENVETLIVALVAALFIRQYLVEPYKIPTGSMAPTLRGVHRDIRCPACQRVYETGCEDAAESRALGPSDADNKVSCPTCDTPVVLGSAPLRRGDKILANKLVYLLRAPRRWEVVVFHYAAENKTYIKRLAGLPGDTLEIRHGDLYINDRITRRPPEVLDAMRVGVYDLARDAPAVSGERWRYDPGGVRREGRSYLVTSPVWTDLSYLPEIRDWLCYNDWSKTSENRLVPVGDLRVTLDCEVPAGAGVGCEIREDDHVYRWTWGGGGKGFEHDLRTVPDRREPLPPLSPGRHRLVFSNIDDVQTLDVDGREVRRTVTPSTEDEGTPASGVRVLGHSGLRILGLVIERDSAYGQEGVGGQDKPIPVPPGRYFFLGDNSPISKDSRKWSYWGATGYATSSTVAEADIQGRAFLAIGHLDWPWAVPYSELTCKWIR